MSITDFISEGVENGQDIEDLFEEVLEYVDIDIQELRNLANRFNYLKEE
jgi:hypothetical protein